MNYTEQSSGKASDNLKFNTEEGSIFIPYNWLKCAEINKAETSIVINYNFARVLVEGEKLSVLYDLLMERKLQSLEMDSMEEKLERLGKEETVYFQKMPVIDSLKVERPATNFNETMSQIEENGQYLSEQLN